jgi:hypothetical protein
MRAAIVLCSVFLVAGAQIALAQDPRTIVQTADQSLQQGNMTVFGPQLQLVISQQTGGTGLYQPLTQLGPITNIAIESVQQIPNGLIVQGRAFHQTGYADWTLEFPTCPKKSSSGISTFISQAMSSPMPISIPTSPPGEDVMAGASVNGGNAENGHFAMKAKPTASNVRMRGLSRRSPLSPGV